MPFLSRTVCNSCVVVLPMLCTLLPRFCLVALFKALGIMLVLLAPPAMLSPLIEAVTKDMSVTFPKQSLPSWRYDLCFCFLNVSSCCQMTPPSCSVAAACPFCSALSYASSCWWLTLPGRSFRATVSKVVTELTSYLPKGMFPLPSPTCWCWLWHLCGPLMDLSGSLRGHPSLSF